MTEKIKIKTVNKQGRGSSVYISRKDLEHLGIRKTDKVIFDLSFPEKIVILSIDKWRKICAKT